METEAQPFIAEALKHIQALSEGIGGRGSCTPSERAAADYAVDRLRALGAQDIRTEPFRAIPSTYTPYALAFTAALLGSLLALILSFLNAPYGRFGFILGAILNLLGMWGMLAETEFASSWVRWISPRAESQYVSGLIPPQGEVRKRVILCAHLDTHRTPVFYSSDTWYALFNTLVALAFLSMLAGTVILCLAAFATWPWVRWVSLGLVPVQVFSLAMCLHADRTPFSPGANDNASGVAAILALAQRLSGARLSHTEVHLAFTGCEEVGDYGFCAYLDAHAARLGSEAIYIVLDEVALGQLKFLTSDGLLLKRKTHPEALRLARQVQAANPQLKVIEGPGVAYTDALLATRRGLVALTLCTIPPAGSMAQSHWHQMTDTLEHINIDDLANTMEFTWSLLQVIDKASPDTP